MDNRPTKLDKNVIVSRERSLVMNFQFPEGYAISDPSIRFRIDRMPYSISTSASVDDQRISINIPVDQIQILPNFIDFYLVNSGEPVLFGVLCPRTGGGSIQDSLDYSVSILGDQIFVVEISSAEVIGQLSERVAGLEEIIENFPIG